MHMCSWIGNHFLPEKDKRQDLIVLRLNWTPVGVWVWSQAFHSSFHIYITIWHPGYWLYLIWRKFSSVLLNCPYLLVSNKEGFRSWHHTISQRVSSVNPCPCCIASTFLSTIKASAPWIFNFNTLSRLFVLLTLPSLFEDSSMFDSLNVFMWQVLSQILSIWWLFHNKALEVMCTVCK